MSSRVAALLAPALGGAVCAGFGLAAVRPPVEAPPDTARIVFSTETLNPVDPGDTRHVRPVAPALEKIAPWISAVGAAVAVVDVDGDTHGEVCLVDPRDDTVRLFAAPGSRSTFPTTDLDLPGGTPEHVAPMGCVPADLDEDGDEDVLVYYWGRPPALFLNVGPGDGSRWEQVDLTTPGEVWNTTAVNVLDVDGDGHLDVLVGNYFPDGARVLDTTARADDRMQMQDSMSLARNAGTNRLLVTRPAGTDVPPEVVDRSGAFPGTSAASWTLAFGAQDLTGDGLPELYVANDFGPDQLLVNGSRPGRPAFTERVADRDPTTPKSSVLGRDAFKGMGVAFLHLDDDPMPSIAVSNITSPYALHESNFLFEPAGTGADLEGGAVPFRQRAEERGIARGGWSWDIKAGDLDNDGTEELAQATGFVQGERSRWPELQELAMSNDGLLHEPGTWMRLSDGDDLSGHEPNRLWVLGADGRFQDVGASSGIGIADDVSRGVALLDADRDGRLDLLVANQWGPSRVHRNETADVGAHLQLHLRLPAGEGTRPAIGAGVSVEVDGATVRRQLFPANGHAGVSESAVHVGLGDVPETTDVPLTVTWVDTAGRHTASTRLRPGTHELLLEPTGEMVQR